MNILGVIPARGGSKGIVDKNIIELNGKPLITYTIESAIMSKIDKVVVTTDSKKIASIASQYEVEILIRDSKLATDNSLMLPVIKDVYKRQSLKFDYIITLQPTSPFRNFKHIDEAINKLLNDSQADSLVSVVKVPHNYSPESILIKEKNKLKNYIDGNPIYRRQDKNIYFARNGPSIIINDTLKLMNNNSFYSENTISYEMSKLSSMDIDDVEDLKIAQALSKFIFER